MAVEEVLIIKEQGCFYGIDTDEVEQILRVQDITPMAMTPESIRGICSVEGAILTSLDFSYLLDPSKEQVDINAFKARQITVNTDNTRFSLLVSEVINSVEIDPSLIEYVENKEDIIVALLKHEDEIIQIISVQRLINDVILPTYVSKDVREVGSVNTDKARQSHVQRFLLFVMEEEKYALEIDAIREIISLPESFTAIAESNKEILGMMSLREDLLVVADLRLYYDFKAHKSEKCRIIVSQHLGRHIGLVVDDIVDIQDVEIDHIEGMPENFQDKKINGVLHLNEQLISIVNTDVVRKLVNEQSHLISDQEKEDKKSEEVDKSHTEAVVFKMADEEYAFDIDDVSEIIDMTEITPIADSIEHIKGVINIRGQVISIASLYTILNLQEKEDIEQQIIITEFKGDRVGFVVDKVNDVRSIQDNEMKVEADSDRLFAHILQLEEGKRLVMMFDMTTLFSSLSLEKVDKQETA